MPRRFADFVEDVENFWAAFDARGAAQLLETVLWQSLKRDTGPLLIDYRK